MKKLTKVGITSVLIAGTLFSSLGAVSAKTVDSDLQSKLAHYQEHQHGSLDLAIMNDDKLIESFIKRGILSESASPTEKQTFLKNYVELKGKSDGVKEADPLAGKVKAAESAKHSKFEDFKNGLLKGNGKKNGHLKGTPDSVSETPFTGEAREDQVLVLAVEYADYAHNNIKPDETDNFYEDYNLGHFEDMIFGADGLVGPNGEDFVSMKQYYLEQSGGTYTVDGEAFGWLKVPGTAAF